MFRLSIRSDDLGLPWHTDKHGYWRAGQSWIRPYRHPCLETVLISTAGCTLAAVRERGNDHRDTVNGPVPPQTYEKTRTEWRGWALESCIVEIQPHLLTIHGGTWGTAPLYLTSQHAVLHGSWDLMDLWCHMRVHDLEPLEVTRLLTFYHRYGHSTLFRGVHRLTERATASFISNELRITYPSAAPHFLPRQLRLGADPASALGKILDTAVSRRPIDPERAAVQLSGGMDSTSIAASLGALYPSRVSACAMMLPGPAGAQQRRRREHLITALALGVDHQVAAEDHLPFTPGGDRATGRLSPYEEPYAEAASALVTRIPGAAALFTGFGGDEILHAPHRDPARDKSEPPPYLGPEARNLLPYVDEEIAPATYTPEPALMAIAATSPLALRRGIWPIAPFTDPEVVQFAEWLPLEWKRDKRLLRAHLAALPLSAEIVHPPLRENFAEVMAKALRENIVPLLGRWADHLILADLGFVEPAVLRYALQQGGSLDRRLYAIVALETTLRNLARPR